MSGWALGTGGHGQPPPASATAGTAGSTRPVPGRRSMSIPFGGGTTGTTTHLGSAGPQKSPQSFRLFLMMTSVTASKTNCTFLVSVAQVKWV